MNSISRTPYCSSCCLLHEQYVLQHCMGSLNITRAILAVIVMLLQLMLRLQTRLLFVSFLMLSVYFHCLCLMFFGLLHVIIAVGVDGCDDNDGC